MRVLKKKASVANDSKVVFKFLVSTGQHWLHVVFAFDPGFMVSLFPGPDPCVAQP